MKHTQQGFATLLVTVILLLLGGMAVLSTSRTVFFEQKTANNAYKHEQALAAARAGVEKGIAYLASPSATPPNKNSLFDRKTRLLKNAAFPIVEKLGNGYSGYSIAMSQPDAVNDPFLVLVTATGCADGCTGCPADCPASATVSQLVKFRQLMPNLPDDALIARRDVFLGGSTSAQNATGKGFAVLAGGSVDAKNATAAVAQNNQLLHDISAEAFFEWFFGESKADVKAAVPNLKSQFPPPDTGGVFWIDGDVEVHAHSTYGSPSDPVVLIVDGNMQINGGVTVFGVVYVVGGPSGWVNSGGGTANIIGAAVSEAGATATGNLDITKDQSVLNSITATTRVGRVTGSWKDF